MLVSTTSFTIEKHFCKGLLIDVSVFANAEKCSEAPCSSDSSKEEVEDPGCCNDIVDVVEGQDHIINKDFDDLDFDNQSFLIAFSITYHGLYNAQSLPPLPYVNYHSPKIVTNKQVDYQVFLI